MASLLAVVVSLSWVYGRTALHLVREWTSSADASYGVVLAAVALGVVWRRRAEVVRAATGAKPRNSGLVLLLCALLLGLTGRLAADVFLTRVSLVCVLAGILAYSAGPAALRTLTAPFVFLLLAIPLPALIVNAITLPMQLVASRIAELSLAAMAVPVYREGNLLMLPSSTLEVAEACSGLRSLVSLAAVGVVLAWTLDRRPARRVALVLAAVPVAVFMNGLRIAATGVAVEQWGAGAGKGAWHELTGWLTFVGSMAVLVGVRRLLSMRNEPRRNALVPA